MSTESRTEELLTQSLKQYESFGSHGWRQHEHQAFTEFLEQHDDLDVEAITVGQMSLRVRLIEA